jgi:hypothetical protein
MSEKASISQKIIPIPYVEEESTRSLTSGLLAGGGGGGVSLSR